MKYCIYLFAILVSITLISCSSDTEIPAIGSTPTETPTEMMEDDLPDAPDFNLETLEGQNMSLAQFEDKTLVIFFFGHNCPPCISVGPELESDLNQEFGSNDNFEMIGIDVWDGTESQVEIFKDRTASTYPLGLRGSSVVSDFGSARDRLVVINSAGKIAFRGTSVARNNLEEVKELVTSLLN